MTNPKDYFGEKLSDLPLSESQMCRVLEWFAWKMWILQEEASGQQDYYGKSYDPLKIEFNIRTLGGVAHSYALSLAMPGKGTGRHHDFDSLEQLEHTMTKALVEIGEWLRTDALEGINA